MKKVIFIFFSMACIFSLQALPQMRQADKIRIREAIQMSKQVGDKIWKGINEVPFVVLLVTDSIEFLVNHPYPSDDFKVSEEDKILNTKIYYRPRQFSPTFLATFPAVNGLACIVVGTPENTGKNSTDWIITLLHEHFHQYEFADPDYFNAVNNLDLSGGDNTGMWQLNYAFPYEDAAVIKQYKIYTEALQKAFENKDKASFDADFKNYVKERQNFKVLLKPADYRYFSFQIWQEGLARYTEYCFISALENYKPSREVVALKDFVPVKNFKETFATEQKESLKKSELNTDKRICFYAIGFEEGLLLDKVNPQWRDQFLKEKFYMEQYIK